MNITIVIFCIVLAYYLMLGRTRNATTSKNKLARLSCLLLAFQSGLRHVIVGPDTYGYYCSFIRTARGSWVDALSGFYLSADEFRDPAYNLVEKVFSTFIPSWQLYLVALGFLYYMAMFKLWKRYIHSAEGVVLATLLVLSLFNVIALSGMRQQITMALSMLLIPYLEDRRWKVVVPVVLLGSLIHISILFYLAFIPFMLSSRHNGKSLLGLAIIMIPIIAILSQALIGFLAGTLENDYYMGYATSASNEKPYVYVALCTLISIFIFMNYNLLKGAPSFLISSVLLMTITFPLIIQNGSLIRLGQYFTIYMMISLPYILDQISGKQSYYLGMGAVLTFFILKSSSEYHFYWENISELNFIPFGID